MSHDTKALYIYPALTQGSGLLGNASFSEPISIPRPSTGIAFSTSPERFLRILAARYDGALLISVILSSVFDFAAIVRLAE